MISDKLKRLFLFSIVLWIAHGIEESLTGFYNVDWSYLLTLGKLHGNLAVTFIIYQLVAWALLGAAYVLFARDKLTRVILVTVGLVMFLELQHLYEVVVTGRYYPGVYTAILFPIIGFFFWKELFKCWKTYV